MDKETLKNKKLTRLEDMLVNEVSVVNKAANKQMFLIVKSEEGTGDGTMNKETQVIDAEAQADAEFDNAFRETVAKNTEESFEEPAPEAAPVTETVEKTEETPVEETAPAAPETAPEAAPVVVEKAEETPAEPVAAPVAITKSDLDAELAKFTPAADIEALRNEFTAGLTEAIDSISTLSGHVAKLAKALNEEREGRKADREALTKALETERTKVAKATASIPASRPVEGASRRELPQADVSAEWDIDMTRPLRGGVSKSIDFGRDDE